MEKAVRKRKMHNSDQTKTKEGRRAEATHKLDKEPKRKIAMIS